MVRLLSSAGVCFFPVCDFQPNRVRSISRVKIIFIVGASRSGTTMLNRVLGNHPRVAGLNELHYFGDLWSVDDGASRLELATLERIAAELLRRIKRSLGRAGR